jgi:hypothetical protein
MLKNLLEALEEQMSLIEASALVGFFDSCRMATVKATTTEGSVVRAKVRLSADDPEVYYYVRGLSRLLRFSAAGLAPWRPELEACLLEAAALADKLDGIRAEQDRLQALWRHAAAEDHYEREEVREALNEQVDELYEELLALLLQRRFPSRMAVCG